MTAQSVPDNDWVRELDGGTVAVDGSSGVVVGFRASNDPDRRFLLEESADHWHDTGHRWGNGFVVTDHGSFRWNAPTSLTYDGDGWTASHRLSDDLQLIIRRSTTGVLNEQFELRNTGTTPIRVDVWGIYVPVRDLYESAQNSLRTAVHAHVWTGGRTAWLLAEPMSGTGPVLTMRLVTGALHAYSIESRNERTSSNVRGHIVVHPVDARAPGAFGGQNPIDVLPGRSHTVGWEVAFAADRRTAERLVGGSVTANRFSAPTASTIELHGVTDTDAVQVLTPGAVVTVGTAVHVSSPTHGTVDIEINGSRFGLFFHAPLEELVRARVHTILGKQRAVERSGVDAAAFVSLDTRTDLRVTGAAWPDWSDGAERLAMVTLLQQSRLAGLVSDVVDDPIRAWALFARTRLLDETAAPRWGSESSVRTVRLYNAPWLARFFADQFVLFGDPDDLSLAHRILERSYELGAEAHLSIGHPEAVLLVARLLHERGETITAEALRGKLRTSAKHFAELSTALPAHEVNYEQSMVAPLVTLLAVSLTEFGDDVQVRAALDRSVRWLEAFSGPQPHARLHGIGIRHWDGYWFGALRRWGDVFPHHWSVLTAVAWTHVDAALQSDARKEAADEIFRANLVNVAPDGSATSAFVFPSAIDGNPAHSPDPLANDQDWALVLALRTGWRG